MEQRNTPLQRLGPRLFRVGWSGACVIKGTSPERSFSAQREGVHPVPMPLQALFQVPILQYKPLSADAQAVMLVAEGTLVRGPVELGASSFPMCF